MAVAPDGAVISGGMVWEPIDLGTGLLTYSGSSDLTLAKIAP